MIPLDYQHPLPPPRIVRPWGAIRISIIALLSLAWNGWWIFMAWSATAAIDARALPGGGYAYRGPAPVGVMQLARWDHYALIPVLFICAVAALHWARAAFLAWQGGPIPRNTLLVQRLWVVLGAFLPHLLFWTWSNHHAKGLGLWIDLSPPPGVVFACLYAAPGFLLILFAFVFTHSNELAVEKTVLKSG